MYAALLDFDYSVSVCCSVYYAWLSAFLCIVMTGATTDALVVQPYTLGSKAVYGCMVDRYCGGTFYLPTHHGTNVPECCPLKWAMRDIKINTEYKLCKYWQSAGKHWALKKFYCHSLL